MSEETPPSTGRPDPVLFLNGRMEVVSASDEAEAVLGYTAQDLRGRALTTIFPDAPAQKEGVSLPGLAEDILTTRARPATVPG